MNNSKPRSIKPVHFQAVINSVKGVGKPPEWLLFYSVSMKNSTRIIFFMRVCRYEDIHDPDWNVKRVLLIPL